jgi:hypothetical protein
MTSRERMLTALRCQEPDRLPIYVWGVPAWNEEWVAACDASYKPVIEITAQYGDYQWGWGPDVNGFITASTDFTTSGASRDEQDWVLHITTLHTPEGDLTSSFRSSKRGIPGMQGEFYVKEPEDAAKILSIPYVAPQPDCSGFFATERQLGDRGLLVTSLNNPLGYVYGLMGSEMIALWSVLHRDLLLELIEHFTQRMEDLLRYLLAQGVGPVFMVYGDEYASPPLHGPRDFQALCADFEKRLTKLVHDAGGLWFVHCHGPVGDILEQFVDFGTDGLHPIEPPPMGNVTLAEAKRRLRGRICIEGNIQIGDIYAAPTGQIERQVREAIEVAAPGGGFILSTTASPHTTVLKEQTVRNYVAFVETAVKYGW